MNQSKNEKAPHESLLMIDIKYTIHEKMKDGNLSPMTAKKDSNFAIIDNIKGINLKDCTEKTIIRFEEIQEILKNEIKIQQK